MPKRYTDQFRSDAVDLAAKIGTMAAADQLGVSPNSLRKWRQVTAGFSRDGNAAGFSRDGNATIDPDKPPLHQWTQTEELGSRQLTPDEISERLAEAQRRVIELEDRCDLQDRLIRALIVLSEKLP